MWSVLLVEDEVFVRELVKELIRWEEMGFVLAAEASDGIEALEYIKRCPPDLVITDIMMPRLDGLELLKETRKAGITSKFVMLTCMGDFEYVRQAMEFGASNYILKLSMSVNNLRETLSKLNKELTRSRSLPHNEHAQSDPISQEITHPEVKKIIQYIEQNYDKDISVKSLSEYVMMGENYVSSLFKKKMGQSLIHYLHKKRVGQALHYLEKSDLPVHEIGLRVGFVNDNYFIKIFKRMVGETPGQYRQRTNGTK